MAQNQLRSNWNNQWFVRITDLAPTCGPSKKSAVRKRAVQNQGSEDRTGYPIRQSQQRSTSWYINCSFEPSGSDFLPGPAQAPSLLRGASGSSSDGFPSCLMDVMTPNSRAIPVTQKAQALAALTSAAAPCPLWDVQFPWCFLVPRVPGACAPTLPGGLALQPLILIFGGKIGDVPPLLRMFPPICRSHILRSLTFPACHEASCRMFLLSYSWHMNLHLMPWLEFT